MKKIVTNACLWIAKHKLVYFILNFTWGLLYTLIGGLIFLVMLPFSKVYKYNYILYLETKIPGGWGFEMGATFMTSVVPKYYIDSKGSIKRYSKDPFEDLYAHEFGHTCQNALMGPLFIFILLAGIIRYWYRELHYIKKGKTPKTEYDDIWFEGSATDIGISYRKWKQNEEKKYKLF